MPVRSRSRSSHPRLVVPSEEIKKNESLSSSSSSSSTKVSYPSITSPSPYINELDESIQWLYTPHTVTGLVIVLGVIVYHGFPEWFTFLYSSSSPSSDDDTPSGTTVPTTSLDMYRRRGLTSLALSFLLYCALQLRDSILVRPHPMVWRIIHGIGLLYLFCLVYLLAFPTEDARRTIRIIYPEFYYNSYNKTFLNLFPIAVNDSIIVTTPASFLQSSVASSTLLSSTTDPWLTCSSEPCIVQPPPHNYRQYATDCRIYTPDDPFSSFARLKETFFDIFILAHFIGWWGKALLIRDYRLCWTLSILWEIVEYTMQSILVNFTECYWDHWILDVLLCNGLGIFIGMMTVHYLQAKTYDWSGMESKYPLPMNPLQQLKRVLYQFRPYEFTMYEWEMFSTFSRFLAVLMFIIIIEIIELNAFLLKYVLYLPPEHPLNTIRLLIWFGLALPATREYYAYVVDEPVEISSSSISSSSLLNRPLSDATPSSSTDKRSNESRSPPSSSLPLLPSMHRLGTNLWLTLTIVSVECLIIYKYSRDTLFTEWSIPFIVQLSWIIAILTIMVWIICKFIIFTEDYSSSLSSSTTGSVPVSQMNQPSAIIHRIVAVPSLSTTILQRILRPYKGIIMNGLVTIVLITMIVLVYHQDVGYGTMYKDK